MNCCLTHRGLKQVDKALRFVKSLYSRQWQVTNSRLPVEWMRTKSFRERVWVCLGSLSRGQGKPEQEKDSTKRKQNVYHGIPGSQVTSWKRNTVTHFERPNVQKYLDWGKGSWWSSIEPQKHLQERKNFQSSKNFLAAPDSPVSPPQFPAPLL